MYQGKQVIAQLMNNFTSSTSNREHMIREIHDTLQAYYKVARKRFVDYICLQAAGYFLLNGPETPFTILTSDFISNLSREEVQDIAGEEVATRQKRERLQKEIEDLEKGKSYLV